MDSYWLSSRFYYNVNFCCHPYFRYRAETPIFGALLPTRAAWFRLSLSWTNKKNLHLREHQPGLLLSVYGVGRQLVLLFIPRLLRKLKFISFNGWGATGESTSFISVRSRHSSFCWNILRRNFLSSAFIVTRKINKHEGVVIYIYKNCLSEQTLFHWQIQYTHNIHRMMRKPDSDCSSSHVCPLEREGGSTIPPPPRPAPAVGIFFGLKYCQFPRLDKNTPR
jgi:hypothetical protein